MEEHWDGSAADVCRFSDLERLSYDKGVSETG